MRCEIKSILILKSNRMNESLSQPPQGSGQKCKLQRFISIEKYCVKQVRYRSVGCPKGKKSGGHITAPPRGKTWSVSFLGSPSFDPDFVKICRRLFFYLAWFALNLSTCNRITCKIVQKLQVRKRRKPERNHFQMCFPLICFDVTFSCVFMSMCILAFSGGAYCWWSVDGKNLAPRGCIRPWAGGINYILSTFQLVQDFFHQQ